MGIETSELFDDIVSVINNRANVSDTRFKYSLNIIGLDSVVSATKIHAVDIVRDFVSRYGDYMTLTITVNRLEYDRILYPGRENLIGELIVEGVHDKSGIAGGDKAGRQYRVKLTDAVDDRLVFGDTIGSSDVDKATELKDITIQLIDLNLELLRVKEITTIVRDTKVNELLHVVVSDKGEFKVSIYPPDKVEVITQLVIGGQETIKVADFPSWLQKYGGGVYKDNIGFYCYNGWVYVYPLFRVSQETNRRKVTICSVGPGQIEGLDKTYSVEPGKLSILSSGKVEMEDTTDKLTYNLGNGVRFNIPNFLRDGVSNVDGVCEVTGSGLHIHGINNDVMNNVNAVNQITNNPFYEVSRISSNRGVKVSLIWENANPSLIYPNMEVVILYKSGDTTNSMKGVIVGMDYNSTALDDEGNNITHVGNAILHLFLDNTIT